MNSQNANKQIQIHINGGIISQIYSHIVSTSHDFFGILLGNARILHNTKNKTLSLSSNNLYNNNNSNNNISNTNQSLSSLSQTFINIDQIHLIFETLTSKTINKFISTIQQKDPLQYILALCSCKAHSYPVISLKEQELYFAVQHALQNPSESNRMSIYNPYGEIPLLFGSFVHNKSEYTVNFESKFYIYNNSVELFESYPFNIINIKPTVYSDLIEHTGNYIEMCPNVFSLEKEVSKLREEILINLENINTKQSKQIKEYKKRVNIVLENYRILVNRLKRIYKS